MKKMYDIVAVTGFYEDRDGNEKKNYVNVGSVMKGDNGPFLVMKRWFNPASVEAKKGSDSIFLSLFEPKDDEKPARRRDEDDERPAKKPANRSNSAADMDDDIPFADPYKGRRSYVV